MAEVAEKEKIDLSTLSREDYADYAIKNCLAINDTLLRVNPAERNCKTVTEVQILRKKIRDNVLPDTEKDFHKFSHDVIVKSKLPESKRILLPGVKILSGTKDSNSWLFFSINSGTTDNAVEVHKSYFSFKDLNDCKPQKILDFMKYLQENGYNGGLKTFQDLTEQGTVLNDQVVMHGASETDAKNALDLARKFFAKEIGTSSLGLDKKIAGKMRSYSEILAARILAEVKKA